MDTRTTPVDLPCKFRGPPKVPQHTHSPAWNSLRLQSQEQNVLVGRCMVCKAAVVLCVIPPLEKSNGI